MPFKREGRTGPQGALCLSLWPSCLQLCRTAAGEAAEGLLNSPQTGLAAELPHVAAPLSAYIASADQSDSNFQSSGLQPSSLQMQPPLAASAGLAAEEAAAVAMLPQLAGRPRLYQLSEKAVLSRTGGSMLGLLTQLNLHGSALKKIEVSCHLCRCLPMVDFAVGQ